MRRSDRRRAAVLLVALGLGGCAAAGDAGDEPGAEGTVTALSAPAPALGEPLMICLAQARNFHHKADVLLRDGRVGDAIGALREVLAIPCPPDAAEAEDVVLDARARLATLLVTAGRLDEALAVVDQGIAGARRRSFFLANLHAARGEVFEARSQLLAPGDLEASRRAGREAIVAFDRSIAINQELLRGLPTEEDR